MSSADDRIIEEIRRVDDRVRNLHVEVTDRLARIESTTVSRDAHDELEDRVAALERREPPSKRGPLVVAGAAGAGGSSLIGYVFDWLRRAFA